MVTQAIKASACVKSKHGVGMPPFTEAVMHSFIHSFSGANTTLTA